MGRVVHFEIQADDLERAKAFYAMAFDWAYEDYSEFTGSPYFGVITGEDGEMGINGGLLQRPVPAPGLGFMSAGVAGRILSGLPATRTLPRCCISAGGIPSGRSTSE